MNLLDQAIRLSQRDDKEGEPDDYSYIWRPAIEQPRHVVDNVRGMLVSAVCSAAERSARQDPTGTTGIISGLENRGWRIFHRIALHILQHWERFLRTDRLHPALYGSSTQASTTRSLCSSRPARRTPSSSSPKRIISSSSSPRWP